MFISKAELKSLKDRIDKLEGIQSLDRSDVQVLREELRALISHLGLKTVWEPRKFFPQMEPLKKE